MSTRERTTRKWVTKVLSVVAVLVALFVLVFSLFSNPFTRVYGLSKEVSTEAELKSALEAPEYDEIIVTASITLTNGTTLDGDLDDDGVRKTIRALVTGTTDQGVINSNASNYTLFYIAKNATVHINNCIIKGGRNSAIVNGASDSATSNNSTLYIDKSQISNSGSASTHGGGIRNTVGGKIVLTNSSITRNVAEYGAGFQNQQGTFILDNCSVSENRSLSYGGGGGENTGNNKENGTNAYMYIYNSTIANNTSKEIGGGINNCKNGNLYVINSTVAGNATTNGTFSGGGIGNNDSTLVCTNSILLDNVYLSSDTVEEQDAYEYSSGSVTLEGCVYGTVTGKTAALANAIKVEDSCYKASEDDSVFAATKTGSLINEDGSQGTLTYNQVALVKDENGVTYAPIASDSMAISGNSSLTPVKVEFDHSNLSDITYNTGDSCSSTTIAPTTIGGGMAMKDSERIVTVTVFVNQDFQVSGGTVYGDSYIVDTEGTTDITLSATQKANKENETVVWTLVNEDSKELTIISTENPYTIDTSSSSDIMQNSWDASKNAYDIVLQPICMSLDCIAADKSVDLSWNLSWSNTYSSSYNLTNTISSYEVYYGLVNDFNSSSTTYYQETTSTNITVSGLSNETTYYFFVVPKFNNKKTEDSVGYVTETPVGSGVKTYVLTDSIEDGASYLIVSSSSAGSANALVSGSNAGSFQNVTVKTLSGASYIEVDPSDAMLWTVTQNNTNYRIHSGDYYISLSRNNRILSTTAQNLTVAFTDSAATIGYSSWGTYYLDITGEKPGRSTDASNVYFYKLKSKADAPTTIQASMQSTMGVDSGRITGLTTAMEYSTDGLNWMDVTRTTMENVAVGNYYFRYKETFLSYASAAVTVKVLPKCIIGLSIKQSLNLNYTAFDSLDLSNLIITIIYNDETTKDVAFNDFNSLDSSVYEREDGVITVSKTNGVTLHCSDNGTKIIVDLDGFSATTLALNISHKLNLVDALAPTCENNGHNAYYICDDCGAIYDTNHNEVTLESLSVPSIGHTYGDATYVWSSDNSSCTATLVCQNDASHTIIEEANITSEITTAPTCTNTGTMTYTATFSDSRFATQTKTVQMEALGHDYDYSNGTWDWHNNYYVTLEATCKNDSTHKTTLQATITNEITKEATCLEDGIRTYTAKVIVDGIDYTKTQEEKVEKLGHNYSYPSYVWSSDNSSCTATRVCQNDASHKIIEEATITSNVTLAPTCTNTGTMTYTATFSDSSFATQTKNAQIAALGHDYEYSNGTWNWQSVYYVTLTFSCTHDASHTDIHQATITSAITKDATCLEAGIRTYTATVVVDGNTYTDTFEEEIPAIGHNYGSPSFEWSSDFKTCTGTVVCQNDPAHIITETVNSTSEIYQEPTCLEEGTGLFTAEFTNSYFYTQKKYTVIPALGHDYEITYTWDGNSSVTALAICKHDNTHKVEETVNTSSERNEPTCVNTGLITYSAIFENVLFEEQTKEIVIEALGHTPLSPVKENEVLPTCEETGSYDLVTYCDVCGEEIARETIIVSALGHTYGEVTYTWSTDNKQVTASRTCETCGNIESEVVNTTFTTIDPVCTEAGKITYTAVFENPVFETQNKEVILEALGHTAKTPVKENEVLPTCETTGSYDLVTYCTVCGEELGRETIIVPAKDHTYTYHEEVLPTCLSTGMKAYYTCDVCDKVFDIDKNETTLEALALEALGHKSGTPVKENEVLPTCEETGSYDLVTYCTVCGEEIARETIIVPAKDHTYTYHEEVHPTCLSTGMKAYYTCDICGKVFDIDKNETTLEALVLDALGHTSGTPVKENEVLPTCEETGSYDLVTYCTVCGEELSREAITVQALGHTYGEVTYTWSSDNKQVTAKRICSICNHEESEISLTTSVTVEPSCTTKGKITYTAAFKNPVFEIQKKEVTLEALGHLGSITVKENEVLPTCENTGSYDLVVYCDHCGIELSRETIIVSALGHIYGDITYTWSSDNKQVTASRTCETCGNIESEVVNTTFITIDPVCTEAGKITYTAVFENSAFETQTKEILIEALGHNREEAVKENEIPATCYLAGSYDLVTYCSVCGIELSRETVIVPAKDHSYGEATYEWSSDFETVTATRVCMHDASHVETETVTTSYKTTVQPTCIETGIRTYTAVFSNLAFETQTKDEIIPALGHKAASSVIENRKEATCLENGSYDVVVYCSRCLEELSRETIIIPAKDHSYGEVTYTWSSDNMKVTAKRVCSICGGIDSEAVDTTSVEVAPSCLAIGHITYTAVFENSAFETQIKEVTLEALGHNYQNPTYTWNSDNSLVTATIVCLNDSNHIITDAVNTTLERVEATCTKDGYILYTAVFENELFDSQEKNIVLEALGHSYGEVTYTWSSDNMQVTAERICSICGSIDRASVATTSVEKAPSCNSSGYIRYTAVFENSVFETQTKEVTLDSLGHNYQNPTYTWSSDHTLVTARISCIHDDSHTIIESVKTTSEITVSPTCLNKGIRTFTATFTGEYFENQIKTIEIDALGHSFTYYASIEPSCLSDGRMEYYSCDHCNTYFDSSYNEVEYEDLIIEALGHNYDYDHGTFLWDLDNLSARYYVYCLIDSTHVLTFDCEITSNRTKDATCTDQGEETYYAKVNISGNEYSQTKKATIPSLGHEYDYTMGTWDWSIDYTSATISFSCIHDSNHLDTYNASITSAIKEEATCLDPGILVYTAKVSLNGITYLDSKEVAIPLIAHSYKHYDEILPTCEGAGILEHYICLVCGSYFDKDYNSVTSSDLILDVLGHEYDYANGTFIFANDYTSATYIVSCMHDASHKESFTALVTSEVLSLATHTETGKISHTATVTVFGSVYTKTEIEETPRLHHTVSTKIARKEATCLENGNILYYYCEDCGIYYSDAKMTIEIALEDTIIEALGHTYTYHEEVPATCLLAGMKAHYTCDICGCVFDIDKNETRLEALGIDALGHTAGTPVKENEVLPTCETTGSYDLVTYCTVCGEEISRETIIVPAKGHTYTYHDEVLPNCTTTGMKAYYTCDICGCVFDIDKNETRLEALLLEALGHTAGTQVKENEVLPTCLATGSYDLVTYCTLCGEELSRDTITTPALGHTPLSPVKENEVLPTCEDAGSYDLVTYCDVCGIELRREVIIVPAKDHTYTYHDEVLPTCLLTGMQAHYTCDICEFLFDIDKNKTTLDALRIEALGHTLATPVKENEVLPTCLTTGSYDLVTYCSLCGEEISRETVIVPSLGHSYGDVTYTWSSDFKSVIARRVCDLCSHKEEEVSSTTNTIVSPSCITGGNIKYIATFTNEAFKTQTHIEILPAIGHDYVTTYTWSSEYKQVTATAICAHDSSHRIVEISTTTSKTIKESCIVDGEITYTATFTNDTFETQVKEVRIPAAGHTLATPVKENEVLPTCLDTGSYDFVTYCLVCGEEISRETKITPALGHTLGIPVKENEVLPTCLATGSYDLVTYCTVCGTLLSKEEVIVPSLGHHYIHHDSLAPTCEGTGNYEYYTCSECDKYFDLNKNEVEYEDLIIDSLGHTLATPVKENEVLPTCEETGSYDFVTYCSVCGIELSREHIVVDSLGHSYCDVTYTWSSDNKQVTAERICSICGHKDIEVSIARVDTIDPTCNSLGKITYTAEFENSAFDTQIKTVSLPKLAHSYKSIVTSPTCEAKGYTTHVCELCKDTYIDNDQPALGHSYDQGRWTWNNDYSEAFITFSCNRCDHEEVILAEIQTIYTAPTCILAGSYRYEATASFDGLTYKDIQMVTVDALGHTALAPVKENEVLPTCLATGSYDLVTYCTVCKEEILRETVIVPSLGHNYAYSNGTWTWSSDNTQATYIVSCLNDLNHTYSYNAEIESAILKEATCDDLGIKEYTASVTILGVTYIDSKEEVLPMLHHETTIIVPMKAPTCLDDGNILYYHCVECGKYFSDSKVTNEISLEDTILPSLGHTYTYHEEVASTCTDSGIKAHYSCSRCGTLFDLDKNEITDTDFIIPALGHSYMDEVILPTCENQGYTKHTCSICGESYSDTIMDALGHDYQITYEWNRDNTKVIGTITCSHCDFILKEEANTTKNVKNSSCQEEGLITYRAEFTNSLFEVQIKNVVMEKLMHNPEDAAIENLVYSTCNIEGSYDSVIYCSICHEELSRETIYTNKLNHSYHDEVIAPTCEIEGYTIHTCELCGDSYIDTYTNALGHHYYEEVTLPTCEMMGYTTYTCDICGESHIGNDTNALGHDYQITYTWDGYQMVTARAICLHDSAHMVMETVNTSSQTILPSCLVEGSTTYKAVFASPLFVMQVKVIVLEKVAHSYSYHEEVSPSCESDGIMAHYTCSACSGYFDLDKNEIHVEDLVIHALGHSYIEEVIAPTCENQGYTTHTCSICGDSYSDTIMDALGHSYIEEVILPTCENQGYTTHTCSTCGESYIDTITDALGHKYSISYLWNSDDTLVTATAICDVCHHETVEEAFASTIGIKDASCLEDGVVKHIATFDNRLFQSIEKEVILPSLGHELHHHDGKDASCTDVGYMPYDTCNRCDYTTYQEIPALGHKDESFVIENEIEATCSKNGSYDKVSYCLVCGEELSRITIILPAKGHSYSSIVTSPTCETLGYTTHTCSICSESYIDNYTNALGHTYGDTEYIWNSDNRKVTASKTCLRCASTLSETVETTFVITKNPTCTEEGILVITAEFTGFDNAEKILSIPLISHKEGNKVKENEILSTCEKDGSYDLVTYCSECGIELSKEEIVVAAKGHTYDYSCGTWSWMGDYSSADYISLCINDYKHKDVLHATVTATIVKEATDLETGLIRYTAEVIALGTTYTSIKEEVIPTTSHEIHVVYEVEPTCITSGNITYYYCENCNTYYKDANLEIEIAIEDTILPALGHDYVSHSPLQPSCTLAGHDAYKTCTRCDYTTIHEIPALGHHFEEIVINPTCIDAGYTLHSCTNCNESYKDTYVSALGHEYQISYEWKNDDSKCIAKAVCKHNGLHIILEEVNTKSSIVTIRDCENDGLVQYTATFLNPIFDAQIKLQTLKALGHSQGEMVMENIVMPSCTNSGSHDEVYYCSTCGSELRRIRVVDDALGHSLIHQDGKTPSCLEPGYKPYDTCSVCGYTTYLEIKPLGHTKGEVQIEVIEEATCLSSGAHYEKTYCIVCGIELSSVIVMDKALGHHYLEQIVLPTCTTQGYTTHSCLYCGRSYQDTYVNALGHDYSNIEYVWSMDNTSCDAYAYCVHDHNHMIYEKSYASYELISNPTCDTDGLKIYSAIFTNILFKDQTKNVYTNALGHSYREASYTWNEYNSIVKAERECIVCNHIEEENAHTTHEVIDASCIEDGWIIYSVEFKNTAFENQEKKIILPKIGHSYGDVFYTWNSDYSKCLATRICAHDASHKEMEEAVSSNVVLASTCLLDGLITYTARFENREFEAQVKKVVLPALGHAYHFHETIDPLCLVDGIDNHYSCDRCNEIFDLNHNVVSMDSLVLPMLGHDYDIPTYIWSIDYLRCIATRICKHDHNHIEEEVAISTNNRTDATCLVDGVIHYMVEFKNSQFSQQEADVILPKLGHAYSNPTYEWSSDYTSITATRICMHDHNHIEKETVTTTSKVVLNPTCEVEGLMNYKAYFTNAAFGNTSIDVPLHPLGHKYSAWEVVTLPSVDSYGMIRRICKNDSNHIETKDIPMLNDIDYTYTVVDAATGAKDGLGRYTATFEDVFIMVQVTLRALGFDYSFYKGNTILSKHHGYLGDSLIVPEDLPSYVVNGYVYSFTGWDKEIPTKLDRDINFFATFVISAVIYNDIIIEIPKSLPIDTSYRVVVDKELSEKAFEDKLNELAKNSDYEDFDITTLFRVDFEKDGNPVDLKGNVITIKIKEDAIKDFDSDTTLFYFGKDGEVKEMNYYQEGGYVIFEMDNVGTVGFGNDGYNWLWTVFIIQSISIVVLAGAIVYRKKFRG